MFKIIFLVAIVICVAFMLKKKSKLSEGQTSSEPLLGNEKLIIWIICLLNPIWGGAIFYYGWKNKLPVKAKSANQISLWAFFIELVLAVVAFALLSI
ncbi:MAG: hypothetical protein JWO73_926 [Candidatus Taylorbacteria bacterium]|nr:hypothetical protein [Candidatus Taylorbacteria bacterium]